MLETSVSLLDRLRHSPDAASWQRLVDLYAPLIQGWLRRRLDVTPGMTGMWQVLGSARIPLHEMVKLDYLYRANWSLWLDIKILIRTVPFVIARRGL